MTMFKKLLILLLMGSGALPVLAQCAHYAKNPVFNATGQIVPFASVRACQEPAVGSTCIPLVPGGLWSDRACSQPLPNPMTADGAGNVDFYTPANRVHLQINGPGMTQLDVADVPVADSLQPVWQVCQVGFAPTVSFDPSACTVFFMVLTGNVTSSSIVNQAATSIGRSVVFKLCEDGTGGRTFAWPAGFLTPPNISTLGASNCTSVMYWFDGVNWNLGSSPSALAAIVPLGSVTPGATGAGTYDFSAATVMKLPIAAGATTSANGAVVYDTTNKNWHFFDNGADAINVVVPASVTVTNGDCASWSVASGAITLNDNGGPCATTVAATAHNFLTAYSATTGAFTKAQPACADLSNASPSCSIDATNAGNLASGTLPAARLPNPSASTLGGIESFAPVAHQWINTISTSGVPSATQPGCGDLSNGAPSCSTDTTIASNITAGTLAAARMNPSVAAHTYLGNNGGGTAPAAFVQPVVGDITPGANGQCINTSGSVAVWGSCAGTAGVQTLSVNTTPATVNAASTSPQTMMTFTTGVGQFNVAHRTVKVIAWGTVQSSSAGTTFNVAFLVGANSQACGSLLWTATGVNGAFGGSFQWRVECEFVVTETGASGGFTNNGDYGVAAAGSGISNPVAFGFYGNPDVVAPTDWTAAVAIKTVASFGTSSVSNTCTQLGMIVIQEL